MDDTPTWSTVFMIYVWCLPLLKRVKAQATNTSLPIEDPLILLGGKTVDLKYPRLS